MRIADMDAPARRETVRNPHPLLHAAECLKTRFCITANTIYCVCMICKILYVVFPRSAGEHNRRFSDSLAGPPYMKPDGCSFTVNRQLFFPPSPSASNALRAPQGRGPQHGILQIRQMHIYSIYSNANAELRFERRRGRNFPFHLPADDL